jgi:LacI family transcriptional regulator
MTIRDLAKLARVSPATVSLVLNGKKGISEKKRQHVLKIASEYGYTNTKKRKNKNSANKAILFIKYSKHGMLVEENQGFISSIMDAIEIRCRAKNYSLSIIISNNDLKSTIESINYSMYAGAIVLASELSPNNYSCLDRIPAPYVVLDNPMINHPCSSVTMDNIGDVYRAIQYCSQAGYKSIMHFKSNTPSENLIERHRAFLQFTKEFSLYHNPEEHQLELAPTMMGSYNSMKKYLDCGLDFLECAFADNDTIAIGAIKALKKFGYKIPQDIAIVGFDDIPFSAVSSPPLTTIRVNRELIAYTTVDNLLMQIDNPLFSGLKTRVSSNLVIRDSM